MPVVPSPHTSTKTVTAVKCYILKCTACRWHFVIVLTKSDLSANKNQTRVGDRNMSCLSCCILCLAWVCVRYHSSLLMHEWLQMHLCEIVPLHRCNFLSGIVHPTLLPCAFFLFRNTVGHISSDNWLHCDWTTNSCFFQRSLFSSFLASVTAVTMTSTLWLFLLVSLWCSIWPPGSHLCITPTLLILWFYQIYRVILVRPVVILF